MGFVGYLFSSTIIFFVGYSNICGSLVSTTGKRLTFPFLPINQQSSLPKITILGPGGCPLSLGHDQCCMFGLSSALTISHSYNSHVACRVEIFFASKLEVEMGLRFYASQVHPGFSFLHLAKQVFYS